jgi:hypothetical protein
MSPYVYNNIIEYEILKKLRTTWASSELSQVTCESSRMSNKKKKRKKKKKCLKELELSSGTFSIKDFSF